MSDADLTEDIRVPFRLRREAAIANRAAMRANEAIAAYLSDADPQPYGERYKTVFVKEPTPVSVTPPVTVSASTAATAEACAAARAAGRPITSAGASGYPGMTAGQIHEAALQREWNADAALRREFAGSFGAYKAYVAAKADGRVKVYGLGAVVR